MALTVQSLSLCVLGVIVWQITRKILSWSRLNNVPGPKAESFWTGNTTQIIDRHSWAFHEELGAKYGGVVAINGYVGRKMLFVFDPKAMHHICVKEQHIYEETPGFFAMNNMMFGRGLLSTDGDHHRRQRKLLNPVFSINHMRHMLPLFNDVTSRLKTALTVLVKQDPDVEIDISRWMSRTALELIGQAGLGHSFDSLVDDSPNHFAAAIKAVPTALVALDPIRELLPYVYNTLPHSLLRRLVKWLPSRRAQRALSISDDLWDHAERLLASKKASINGGHTVSSQIGDGKDLLSVLLHENSKAVGEDKMSDEELLGHMATFIFAATDTTSSGLTRILYLLAAHPEVQTKLRQELKAAQADGDISYDVLVSLPYLDAVCREALRLHAPVPIIQRKSNSDTVLPLHTPIKGKDGQMMDEFVVPADTMIYIGILAANRSQEVWGEDSHEFKPERWLSPLPESVSEARIPGIYSHLMTFFAGGRACIGFKFSQLEMKVVLAMMIEAFTFDLPQDKEIYWNFSGIIYPSVGSEDPAMQMPLRVALAK